MYLLIFNIIKHRLQVCMSIIYVECGAWALAGPEGQQKIPVPDKILDTTAWNQTLLSRQIIYLLFRFNFTSIHNEIPVRNPTYKWPKWITSNKCLIEEKVVVIPTFLRYEWLNDWFKTHHIKLIKESRQVCLLVMSRCICLPEKKKNVYQNCKYLLHQFSCFYQLKTIKQ